ncbi:MAG: isoprenylcysteine carboxylmethyltransferase family protein [Verrucomicrobiota bacterium]|nr:isoprenylcysteine carboxylmethyltransferase family protein [Verrucomicrobiota bacterium]
MIPPAQKDNPGVLVFPPLLFLVCCAASGLLHLIWTIPLMNRQASWWLGGVLALLAGSLASWASRTMKRAGTNIRPNQPSLTVVTSGPFRLTRNPMYLSLCILQSSIAILINGWLPLLVVVPLALILHFGVVLREERYLERKFGDKYLAFKQSTRRWI